jgi:hypothetical protein
MGFGVLSCTLELTILETITTLQQKKRTSKHPPLAGRSLVPLLINLAMQQYRPIAALVTSGNPATALHGSTHHRDYPMLYSSYRFGRRPTIESAVMVNSYELLLVKGLLYVLHWRNMV